jgi:hypothetical protein
MISKGEKARELHTAFSHGKIERLGLGKITAMDIRISVRTHEAISGRKLTFMPLQFSHHMVIALCHQE